MLINVEDDNRELAWNTFMALMVFFYGETKELLGDLGIYTEELEEFLNT